MAVPLQHARLDAQAIAAAANGFEQPAAIVCNSHITGLAVARSLAKRGVPVIGLDREPNGVALASNALVSAGICANPIEHEEEFVQDLLAIGAELRQPAVLFGCMDEWVLAMNAHRERLEQFFLFPFADDATVRRILDKSELYREAAALGVPIPRSLDARETTTEEMLAQIGVPSILKPAAKRPFYDAFGVNLFTPKTEDEFGQRLEIYPAGFGTTCLAKAIAEPELEAHAISVLQRLGYYGIAEVEFLRDPRDGEFKLLDINTRPWKWVGLPIASGVELPWLVYATRLGLAIEPAARRDNLVWVSVKDYIPLRARGEAMQPGDPIGKDRW